MIFGRDQNIHAAVTSVQVTNLQCDVGLSQHSPAANSTNFLQIGESKTLEYLHCIDEIVTGSLAPVARVRWPFDAIAHAPMRYVPQATTISPASPA
jgi:hypothetical protein